MADNRIDKEKLAVLIPIGPPRVGGPFGNHLKFSRDWMKTPNPGVQGNAFTVRSAGPSYMAGTLNALTSIKPTVRPKFQSVGDCMPDHGMFEAIEQHLRRAIRHIVGIGIRDEQQLRRTKREY